MPRRLLVRSWHCSYCQRFAENDVGSEGGNAPGDDPLRTDSEKKAVRRLILKGGADMHRAKSVVTVVKVQNGAGDLHRVKNKYKSASSH